MVKDEKRGRETYRGSVFSLGDGGRAPSHASQEKATAQMPHEEYQLWLEQRAFDEEETE
jgi:hypothetical protein